LLSIYWYRRASSSQVSGSIQYLQRSALRRES
jgi:hypothetical protein